MFWVATAMVACAFVPDFAKAPMPTDERVRVLRVGSTGDYTPFSWSWPPSGFDPAVARAYAKDRGLRVEWIRFRWPQLLADLEDGRFDVAMSGVTVRPERLIAGRFSLPVAASGAVVLVGEDVAARDLESLDRGGVRIAVNAGGHLERVSRARFARAEILAVPDNAGVVALLRRGEVDAAVTDTLEAPHWRAQYPEWLVLGPFTRDHKAYLVAPERSALARDLDGWLLDREADGTLAALRAEHLGAGGADATAVPLTALVASIERRLSLMPLVAEAKRLGGQPVEVPAREQRVLDAAVEAVGRAAAWNRVSPPDETAVRELYTAQIEVAKSIQRRVLSQPRASVFNEGFDLAGDLRPALLRIGEQMAGLLVRLPRSADATELVARSSALLRGGGLRGEDADRIAAALGQISAESEGSDSARPIETSGINRMGSGSDASAAP